MNTDEIGGVVRAVLAAVGGVVVAKGYVDNGTMTTIVGALTTIAVAVWSVLAKRRARA